MTKEQAGRKVKYALITKNEYHFKKGQVVMVYWNKQKKEYRTISDQLNVVGNANLMFFKIINPKENPEFFI